MSQLHYDETRAGDGSVRRHYQGFADWLDRTPVEQIAQKREEAERAFIVSASPSRFTGKTPAPND